VVDFSVYPIAYQVGWNADADLMLLVAYRTFSNLPEMEEFDVVFRKSVKALLTDHSPLY
jgi:hypothetical protein